MGRRKKKGALPPRTLRMSRGSRLQSARHWLATQKGRTPVQIAKSYRKRHGVDWACAIRELRALGVRLDPAWVGQLERTLEGAQRARERKKAERRAAETQLAMDPVIEAWLEAVDDSHSHGPTELVDKPVRVDADDIPF
jgi:hypothetical protein